MLSFLSHRSVKSPLHHLRTSVRTLKTFPKALPAYTERWNPTYHNQLKPPKAPPKTASVLRDVKHDACKLERKQLRDGRAVAITGKNNNTWTVEQRRVVKRLNRLLHLVDAGKGELDVLRREAWATYSLAKRRVPGLVSHIPDRAWDVLWALQSTDQPASSFTGSVWQGKRLAELRRDMHAVGKTSTVGIWTDYLENLFLEGKEEQALEEWEEPYAICRGSSRHDYKPEHLEMGAKLYALAGHADRAREIMDELFELYPNWDPTVMLHVLRVHTDTASKKHRAEARKIYGRMLQLMNEKSTMTLDHFNACFIGFLEARDVLGAKTVFRDMIKHGVLAASFSVEDVNETLRKFHLLCCLGTDIMEITTICLQAIKSLPPAYHLHVFGYWMERAVKFNAWQVTTQILDMVFNRGYCPTSSHFNLCLRALLRTQETPQILKAENIGWRMIEETKTVASRRTHRSTAQTISDYGIAAGPATDNDASRKFPPADVTTFALIMQHHADRGQWEYVDYLARRMEETNTRPNATLMNVLMNNLTRKGKFGEAWRLYKSLTDSAPTGSVCRNCGDSGHLSLECPSPRVENLCNYCGGTGHGAHECTRDTVFPDGSSIRCVWKTLRLALGNEETRDDPALSTPRELLAETVKWWKLCRSRHDAERFRTGLAAKNKTALTKLVVHCFSYTNDLAGSLVALHIMRQHFHILPTDECVRLIQSQAAWIDVRSETKLVRSQHNLKKLNQMTLFKLARIHEILLLSRLQRLGYTDEQLKRMSDDEGADLGLNALSEFIRVVMKRTHGPDMVEAMIQRAKEEIGVPDLPTGDMTAFEVA